MRDSGLDTRHANQSDGSGMAESRIGMQGGSGLECDVNIVIVDREPAARAALVELCSHAEGVHVVGQVATGAKAIEAAKVLGPDLMLVDAELPDMTGFEVLRALRAGRKRRTILVTANTRDSATAYAAGALDCLAKPVSAAAFHASIERARAGIGVPSASGRLPVPATRASERPLFLIGERERRLYPLEPEHIDYIESVGNYVAYRIANVEYIARESIKRLATLLQPLGFVRIERSLLLNVRAIAYAQPNGRGTFAFTLVSGARLDSGHSYRDTILAALPLRRRAPVRASAAG
jgi:two-component system, LytTR family, response regulator